MENGRSINRRKFLIDRTTICSHNKLKQNLFSYTIVYLLCFSKYFLMSKEQHIQSLHEIKDIMNRSSRFMSLSGIAGVLAGVFAIIGAWLAYQRVYDNQDYLSLRKASLDGDVIMELILIASSLLILSIGSGIYFSFRKAQKQGESFWNKQAALVIINLAIPLATGGLLCLILLSKGYIGILAPITLIFYGLALVNASKYTLTEIRSLGLLEVALGLIAMQFIGYGLLFWVIGFGVLHIFYGIWMYIKHER